MTNPLIQRRAHRPKPGLPFLGDLCLTASRAHEFCGSARRTLALMAAQKTEGPVFWIRPAWQAEQLHGDGIAAFIDPARLIFVSPRRAEDILWTLEEILRSGMVALAICECPGLPGLTPVRRLHLAAETATREHKTTPLGLLLTPGEGGAPGVESRWHMRPAHLGKDNLWRLERRRARMEPPKSWALNQSGKGFHLAPWHAEPAQAQPA